MCWIVIFQIFSAYNAGAKIVKVSLLVDVYWHLDVEIDLRNDDHLMEGVTRCVDNEILCKKLGLSKNLKAYRHHTMIILVWVGRYVPLFILAIILVAHNGKIQLKGETFKGTNSDRKSVV